MESGTFVTIELGATNKASNTFIVDGKVGNHYLLYHPLYPSVKILRTEEELNRVPANPKGPYQRCLEYASDNLSLLDPDQQIELETLCLFFVVRRFFTKRQKQALAILCGAIARHFLLDDADTARKTVHQNEPLLDDFNRMWYINFREIYLGKRPIKSSKQRITIFNQAGFVLAQLHNKRYSADIKSA